MRLSGVRGRCARMLADLGIDGPTSTDQLVRQLSQQRGRPVRLVAHPRLGEMSGFWIGLDDADTVFYDEALTGLHREHVIAHELAHIAFGHGHDEVMAPEVLAAPHIFIGSSTEGQRWLVVHRANIQQPTHVMSLFRPSMRGRKALTVFFPHGRVAPPCAVRWAHQAVPRTASEIATRRLLRFSGRVSLSHG